MKYFFMLNRHGKTVYVYICINLVQEFDYMICRDI